MRKHRSPSFVRNSGGFNLAELTVVVAIVALLAVLTYAPYSYYSDISRVRLSSERIEQAFSEAKLSASMGIVFPGSDSNADSYVSLSVGSGSIGIYAAKSGSGTAPFSEMALLREVPLEKDVVVSSLPSSPLLVKFSAPSGKRSVTDASGAPVAFTGGTVGLRGGVAGPLSKPFRSVSEY